MDITIAVCTYNRARLLRQTIDSMKRLSAPEHATWEVLIVDNNSDDETAEVIEGFAGDLPIRSAFEKRSGKSFAANTAVEAARGDVIIWTDDDVLVDREWLRAYARAIRAHPDVGIFAGPIEPWFEGDPPSWLQRAFSEVSNAYAALDLGAEQVPLSHEAYPYGANMALKRALHVRRPFDTRIGPHPGTLIRGEEMVLVRELLAEGERGLWIPTARVRHFIPKDRQTIRYLRRYFFGTGQLLDYLEEPVGARFLGRPLWVWREALQSEVLYRLRRVAGRPDRWVRDLRSASVAWGRLKGYPRSAGS